MESPLNNELPQYKAYPSSFFWSVAQFSNDWALGARCSLFVSLCSVFGARCSVFACLCTWCSVLAFGDRCLVFIVRCSCVCARCSLLDAIFLSFYNILRFWWCPLRCSHRDGRVARAHTFSYPCLCLWLTRSYHNCNPLSRLISPNLLKDSLV